MNNIEQTVRAFIKKELMQDCFINQISCDSSLIDLGIMDSVSILITIDFLDKTFGINLDGLEDLNPENFGSISGLCLFIRRKIKS